MKLRVLSLMVPALLVGGAPQARRKSAYNKDGNKLICTVKSTVPLFLQQQRRGRRSSLICVLACAAKRKSAIQLTGLRPGGNIQVNLNHAESQDNKNLPLRLRRSGNSATMTPSDYGRNTGVL